MSALTRAVLAAAVAIAMTACSSGGERPEASPGTPEASLSIADEASPEPSREVDPLKGDDYCASIELLKQYSNQSYGAAEEEGGTSVDLVLLGRRLETIAKAYRRLADQAEGAHTRRAWSRLGAVTEGAENLYRASGRNLASQTVIVEFAKLSEVTRRQLPIASRTLPEQCGLATDYLEAG